VQWATAKTTKDYVDERVSTVSAGLMAAPHPIAKAAGGGIAVGQLIEQTLDVSDYSSAIGIKTKELGERIGAGGNRELRGGRRCNGCFHAVIDHHRRSRQGHGRKVRPLDRAEMTLRAEQAKRSTARRLPTAPSKIAGTPEGSRQIDRPLLATPRATSYVVRSRFKVSSPGARPSVICITQIRFVSSAQWPHLGSQRRHEAGAGISSGLVCLHEPEGLDDIER
jgi:hypothetical protein